MHAFEDQMVLNAEPGAGKIVQQSILHVHRSLM